jgi:hypothetical protein
MGVKATRESIRDYLYDVLECKEIQTKPIINKFLDDILLFDKKQKISMHIYSVYVNIFSFSKTKLHNTKKS